jgi:hypothetical protein
MMAMAMGLLGNQSGNFGQNVGHAGLLGQQAYAIGNDRKQKALQEEQQRQMRDMQMAQMKQAMEDQQFAQQQAPQFFSPGNAPADGTGPVMPPKADLSGYGMALAQRNPTMGMPFIQAGIKDNTPLMMKPGEVAVDRTTFKPVFSAPEKGKFQAGDTRHYESGGMVYTQEFDGKEWKALGRPSPKFKPDEAPKPQFVPDAQGFVYPPSQNGGPRFQPVPGMPASQKNQPSEAELTAAGYATRMNAADKLLNALPKDAVPGPVATTMNNKFPAAAPYFSSEGQQQYRQAQEDWVRAKLRKESGAVIADEEMAREIRVYFPQPGDSEKVIKQKQEARQRANTVMEMAAGKAKGRVGGGSDIQDLLKKYGG